MKRRVVKHGPSTYIISLPTNWVKKYGINKGDELEVNENSKTLLISTDSIKTDLEVSKDISNLSSNLMHPLLVIFYLKGYDKIFLKHNDLKLLEKIQKQIPQLIGYEIVEQDDKTCLIQSISQKIDLEFDNSLRKAFLTLKSMLEMIYEAYSKGDHNTLKNIHLKDLEVNRLCFLCLRKINREALDLKNNEDKNILYFLITMLERYGDGLKDLASNLTKTKRKNKDILNLLKLLLDHYEACYSYFYDATKDKANKEFNIYREIKELFDNIFTKDLRKEEILAVYFIRDCIYKMANFTRMRIDLLKEDKK